MVIDGDNLAERRSESPINATLLKLIHHELGNGLAVLSGYRHLLQRAISLQAHETVPPEPDVWRQRNEQWLSYLQVMHDRETVLNNFLAQLHEFLPGTLPEHFCQSFERADLGVMLARMIEQFAPLFPDQTLSVHMPSRALFILCDPFCMGELLEHIVSHTIAAHEASTPVEITLELSSDPMHLTQEARIVIQIERTLPAPPPGSAELPELWSQVLSQDDREVCLALCQEVLREHGGRIWTERKAEKKKLLFLTLPLVE